MVCCYLLYSGQKATADEALKFYGTKRTHDEKGILFVTLRSTLFIPWVSDDEGSKQSRRTTLQNEGKLKTPV